MRFIDELYELYRGHFNGDEEDITAIVVGVLVDHSREELQTLIDQMDDEEVFNMMAIFMIEIVKRKLAMEDERNDTMVH